MRRLTLSLDALAVVRDSTGRPRSELAAAASLAQLAGVSALRLGLSEELRPVRPADVMELRAASQRLELRIPVSPSLVKVALESRPDRVVLVAESWDGATTATALDPRGKGSTIGPVVRSLEEAGIPVALRVPADLDAVKAAHGLDVGRIEFFTGAIVDLPDPERRVELLQLGDAVRLASKLRLGIAVAGALDLHGLDEVLEAAPAIEEVVVGGALVQRSLLIGMDRAVRDFRERLG